MLDKFKHVLSSIILPKFSNINSVMVRKNNDSNLIYVSYIMNDRMDYHDSLSIMYETESLFKMMGFNKDESVVINFKMKYDV